MARTRIERIELTPLHVPFRAEVRDAMAGSEGGLGMAIAAEEAWLGGDFTICRLVATTDPSAWERLSSGCPRPASAPGS